MKLLLGIVIGAVAAGVAFDWLLKNSPEFEALYAPPTEPPKDEGSLAA